jgi:hypothetical protein
MRYEVLTATTMKMAVFWDAAIFLVLYGLLRATAQKTVTFSAQGVYLFVLEKHGEKSI